MAKDALKLLAHDGEGLAVIAAIVQDSLVKPQDIRFDKRSRTLGLEINRFQWERAGRKAPFFRSRAILAMTAVQSVRSRAMSRDVDAVFCLMDVCFEPAAEAPAGIIRLQFAGDITLEASVECLDVTLADLGPSWPTRRRPQHDSRRG